MQKELAGLQHLIDALDDSRSLYAKRSATVAHPQLRELLARMACMHSLIANDLAALIVERSGEVSRRGSRPRPLRAFLLKAFARTRIDIEMVCVNHAIQREARILRGIHEAVASVRDPGLCDCLRTHQREIERASTEISCLRATMQLRMYASGPRTLAVVRSRAPAPTPQTTPHAGRQFQD